MEQDPTQGRQEKLDIKIKIATPEDWRSYRDLRLEALRGSDRDMLGVGEEDVKMAQEMTVEDWKKRLSFHNGIFVLLLLSGNRAVGMGQAIEWEDNVWSMSSGYIKPKFRGVDLGKKIFAARLREILQRGGKKVEIGIRPLNDPSLRIAQIFGFKKAETHHQYGPNEWEDYDLDITAPEVIKKINEVLNAR